jgi:hypothetical protein
MSKANAARRAFGRRAARDGTGVPGDEDVAAPLAHQAGIMMRVCQKMGGISGNYVKPESKRARTVDCLKFTARQ